MEKQQWKYRMRVDPFTFSDSITWQRYSFWKYNEQGEWFLMASMIHDGTSFGKLLVFRNHIL